MPQVDIVITKDLSYSTRRLKAGDRITVSEQDAKVLVGIGKAERAREPGKIASPPPEFLSRAAVVTPAPTPEPGAVSAMATAAIAPTKPRAARRRKATKRGK